MTKREILGPKARNYGTRARDLSLPNKAKGPKRGWTLYSDGQSSVLLTFFLPKRLRKFGYG